MEVLSHTGKALIITTQILIIGFGIFIFAEFIPNVDFGIYSAFVLMMALVIDLIVLPAILLLIHKKN